MNSDEVERCIDKTPRTPRGIDSAKKSRCNKFVPLGLAQRLSTMVKRERAEVAFFEHQTKMLQRDETLSMSHTTVRTICCRFFFQCNAYTLSTPISHMRYCAGQLETIYGCTVYIMTTHRNNG